MKKIILSILLIFIFVNSIMSMEEGNRLFRLEQNKILKLKNGNISPIEYSWLEKARSFFRIFELLKKDQNGVSIYQCCNTKSEKGITILMEESYRGSMEMMKILIENGADINTQDNTGKTALHYAAFYTVSSKERLELLINNGANINAKDKRGRTALHYASLSDFNEEEVIFLLNNGAFINAEDNEGMTPLDYAIAKNCEKIINVFIKILHEFFDSSEEFEKLKKEISGLKLIKDSVWHAPISYLKIKDIGTYRENDWNWK